MEYLMTIDIPEEDYKLLKKYGYDFKRNAECQAREVAATLRWCSENPDVDSDLIEEE